MRLAAVGAVSVIALLGAAVAWFSHELEKAWREITRA